MKSKEIIKFANNLANCADLPWNIWLHTWHCWLAPVREPYWVPFSKSTGILITALLCNTQCKCMKNLKSAWAPPLSDPMPVPLCYCFSITSLYFFCSAYSLSWHCFMLCWKPWVSNPPWSWTNLFLYTPRVINAKKVHFIQIISKQGQIHVIACTSGSGGWRGSQHCQK